MRLEAMCNYNPKIGSQNEKKKSYTVSAVAKDSLSKLVFLRFFMIALRKLSM